MQTNISDLAYREEAMRHDAALTLAEKAARYHSPTRVLLKPLNVILVSQRRAGKARPDC